MSTHDDSSSGDLNRLMGEMFPKPKSPPTVTVKFALHDQAAADRFLKAVQDGDIDRCLSKWSVRTSGSAVDKEIEGFEAALRGHGNGGR